MRLWSVVVGCLATAVLPLPAGMAGNVPAQFDAKPVCVDIEQRYRNREGKHNARELNFMLFDASSRNCISLLETLLEAGASVSARDRFGNTALLVAARSGHDKAVTYLLERGADIAHANLAGSTALLRAVDANRRRVARLLLKAGADPNAANVKKVSPLIAASYNGSGKLVKLLLKAGADPQQPDASGKGPIVYAAGKGYNDILQLLIEAGADVNRVYGNGLTPLMWASGHSNDVPVDEGVAAVKLLLDRGASLDVADNRGRTALMIAAERDHPEIVTLLLDAGADAGLADRDGMTAGQLAASDAVRSSLKR